MGTANGVIEQADLIAQTARMTAHAFEAIAYTCASARRLILQIVKVRLHLAHVRAELGSLSLQFDDQRTDFTHFCFPLLSVSATATPNQRLLPHCYSHLPSDQRWTCP